MEVAAPVTSVETLPTELLEWLGEKKIRPGVGDAWVPSLTLISPWHSMLMCS